MMDEARVEEKKNSKPSRNFGWFAQDHRLDFTTREFYEVLAVPTGSTTCMYSLDYS